MKRLIVSLALLLLPTVCAAQTTVRALGGTMEPGGLHWILLEIKAPESFRRVAGTLWFNPARLQLESIAPGNVIVPWGTNALTITNTLQQGQGRLGFDVQLINGNSCCGQTGYYTHFLSVGLRDRGGNEAPTFGFDDSISSRRVLLASDAIPTASWIGGSLTPTSSAAGRKLFVDGPLIVKGRSGTLSIYLECKGGENAIGFSLLLPPSHITVDNVTLGSGAATASLTINNNVNTRLGIILALPPGQQFMAGTHEIIALSVRGLDGLVPGETEIPYLWWSDEPVRRELVSVQTQNLPLLLPTSTVAVIAGFEGDVAPRPAGDGVTSLADFVQIGRFAAALDTATVGLEFKKADCAPRAIAGDGRITLADYVQAGRFAVGLDYVPDASGPSSPTSFAPESNDAASNRSSPDSHTRTVLLTRVPSRKSDVTYSVELHNGEGDENAVSFSLELPESMKFVSAEPGDSGAAFHVNQSVPGKIGIILAAQPGQGLSRRLLTLRFEGKGEVKLGGGELVDVNAEAVGVVFAQITNQR